MPKKTTRMPIRGPIQPNHVEPNWTRQIVEQKEALKCCTNIHMTMFIYRCTNIMPMVHFHPANHITFMGLNITLHLNAKLRPQTITTKKRSIDEGHTDKTTTLRAKLNIGKKQQQQFIYYHTTYAMNVLYLHITYNMNILHIYM